MRNIEINSRIERERERERERNEILLNYTRHRSINITFQQTGRSNIPLKASLNLNTIK